MKLCSSFCKDYFTACEKDLALPANFCSVRSDTPDAYYCYPFVQATFTVTDPAKAAKPAYPNMVGKFPRMMSGMLMRPDRPAWWIVDQLGWIWELEDRFDAEEITPILTFQPKVQVGGEMGLIGLAFHPNFANNRRFYLNYVNYSQATVIAQFTWTPGDLDSTAASETTLMSFPQPETNHNGGWMGFSPWDYAHPLADQHYMFIGTGDGGGANDQHGTMGNGQDLTQIYGKMLRVKIPADDALRAPGKLYAIPEDNPFATSMGQYGQPLPEIYAWGLRNAWRCSFDRLTGELWCADVGESRVEEIDIIEKGGNYGWRQYEGTRCNTDIGVANPCNLQYTAPVWEYCHEDFSLNPMKNETRDSQRICNGHPVMGQSITGGFVYRGKRYAKELGGQYLFADFETSILGRLQYDKKSKKWNGYQIADGTRGITRISTFAEHFFTGELYMVSYVPNDIYRLYVGDLNATALPVATALPAQEAAAASTTLGSSHA
jgi:Glucose / Sorbosone dehydrogenase